MSTNRFSPNDQLGIIEYLINASVYVLNKCDVCEESQVICF